ncbi:MAG: 6-bladed beta-propeller [Spirochaetota bacterium]
MKKTHLLMWTVAIFFSISALCAGDDFIDQSYAIEFFKKGLNHFNNREYEAAVDFFRKSLGKAPDDQETRFFLGMAYYKAGYEENAIFEFTTIIQVPEIDPALRMLLSQFVDYLNLKKFPPGELRKSSDYSIGLELKGNLPGRFTLSKITGIDIDNFGNLYATGFGSKIALKISPQGEPIHQYISPRLKPGRLYDIVIDRGGNVYISDFSNDQIYKFSNDGKYIRSIGSPGFGDGQFYGPTSLSIDPDGNLLVIDSGNMRIVKFSPDGEFLLSFGKEGSEDGSFSHPSGIAVDPYGNIYIADHGKKLIGVYDRSGNFISYLKGVKLIDPYGISFADKNKLLVSDGPTIKFYDILHSTWTEIHTPNRLKRVLDTRIDALGQLFACDFEQDTIIQYIPKEDRYRNLVVILDRVDASSYPAIVYYTAVFDADGLPIYGLDQNNFILHMGRGRIGKIDLSYNEVRDSRLNLLFLVEKSPAMQSHSDDIGRFIRAFLDRVSSRDDMAVIGYNADSWIASSFTNSKLKTIDAVLEEKYIEGNAFDLAFRRAIDYLNRRFYKKAMIVITSGNLKDTAFKTYSLQSCLSYAANNYIPVYIVSFDDGKNSTLDYIARGSGGRYYSMFHSPDLPYLYDTIKSYRSPEYVIFFNDVYDPELKNMFLESEVEVDFNGRVGKSRLGFVYP